MEGRYKLPDLPYKYDALEPHMSKEQLTLHHDRHHASYVKNANEILHQIDQHKGTESPPAMKPLLKTLSFNVGGHVLHSLFWENLSHDGGGRPDGILMERIQKDFGSYEAFKKQFEDACKVEGSGWAALSYCKKTDRLMLMQIEKHNLFLMPGFPVLMVMDMWEHAYYVDHQNQKAQYISAFWNLVDWGTVSSRLEAAI